MTQFELLKSKDVDQMAVFLAEFNIQCNPKLRKRIKKLKDPVMCKYTLALAQKRWLESEVEV